MAIFAIGGLSRTQEAWLHAQVDAINQTLAAIKAAIKSQGTQIMAGIATFSAQVEANFALIKAGILALDDKITALQNSPGTLSASDQAALDAIVADSAVLATAASAMPSVTPAGTP